ncbi:MAG: hypothetical protein IKX06_04365 [Clostridia bacterium]|nr:hypothetical protein [Clostridia bacterium]
MKEKIYDIILREIEDDGAPSGDFSLLRYLSETGNTTQGRGDASQIVDGEFDAVMVRLPRRIKQPAPVDLFIALKLKSGIKALNEQAGKLSPKQRARAEAKMTKEARKKAELSSASLSEAEAEKLKKRADRREKRAAKRKERRAERLSRRVDSALETAGRYEPVTVADQVVSFLDFLRVGHADIRDLGVFLCENACTVQAAKLGLAMIGFFGGDDSKPMVKNFCVFEEFTYFALKTLKAIEKDGDAFCGFCVELTEKLSGWGKVAALLELPDRIEDEDLRMRILTHGAQNNIGLYVTAAECAIKGGLKSLMLENEQPREPIEGPLADGICEIFDGLFQADKIKDADSFSEVPDMGTIIASFKEAYRNGAFDNAPEAPRIAKQLKERFG